MRKRDKTVAWESIIQRFSDYSEYQSGVGGLGKRYSGPLW